MSVAENMSGLLQQSCWYPRNPFHSIRPILGDRLLNSLKIIGARSNKFVDQAALDRYVQQAVRERGVGSRRELQVQGGEFCRCGATRIGNDKLSTPIALRFKILHDRRKRLRRVASDHEDRVSLCDILHRERHAAVDAESAQARGCGLRHAKAAVVIDVRGAQCDPCELTEHVSFFISEAPSAEDTNGIGSKCSHYLLQL